MPASSELGLDDIGLLATIGATGSMAAAARELGKVPSALSYQVRRLEERLITVERIVAADHPDFKPTTSGAVDTDPVAYRRSN